MPQSVGQFQCRLGLRRLIVALNAGACAATKLHNRFAIGPCGASRRRAATISPPPPRRCFPAIERTEIAEHDAKLRLFTHRQLARMFPQQGEISQQDARTVVKGPAMIGQGDAVAVAVEQAKPKLTFQILD